MDGEAKIVHFLYRVIEQTNGSIPTHHIQRHLQHLSIKYLSVIGPGNNNLHKFLFKHNETFTVRRGITYLAKYDYELQYGRVFSDMYGRVVHGHRIRLENEYSVYIPKFTAIAMKLRVGDFVQCHASYGAHELQATKVRLVTNPDKEIGPTSPLRTERNSGKPGNKTTFLEGNILVNAEGFVVQLSHHVGQLKFKDDHYKGDIYFLIHHYYEHGTKVLGLQVGDLVFFDAILEADGRWQAGFVWKGLKPRSNDWKEKKRELNEYLAKHYSRFFREAVKTSERGERRRRMENLVALFAAILCFYVTVLWLKFVQRSAVVSVLK